MVNRMTAPVMWMELEVVRALVPEEPRWDVVGSLLAASATVVVVCSQANEVAELLMDRAQHDLCGEVVAAAGRLVEYVDMATAEGVRGQAVGNAPEGIVAAAMELGIPNVI